MIGLSHIVIKTLGKKNILCATEFFTDELQAIVPQKPKETEPQAETEATGEESREEGRKNININFLVIAIVVNTIKKFPFLKNSSCH